MPIALDDIYRARRAIRDFARRTPLVAAPALSEVCGRSVRLKLETMQDIGAFKIRGAANKLLSLTEAERRRGVVAVSSGNHGRGVAAAAARLGMPACILMSRLVPENKVAAIRALGAEIRIVGDSQDEADEECRRIVERDGMAEANPFDDAAVIAGQGTIGLEILEDFPEVDTVVVPLSGGGLAGGIAVAIKSASPRIRVVGVSMQRGPAMIEALKAGRPVFVEELPTLADALGGGIGLDNRHTFALIRDLVDDTVTVSEAEIAAAMRWLFLEERLVAEGGGAVGVAALMDGRVAERGHNVAVIVSGRNVDMELFMQIVNGTYRAA